MHDMKTVVRYMCRRHFVAVFRCPLGVPRIVVCQDGEQSGSPKGRLGLVNDLRREVRKGRVTASEGDLEQVVDVNCVFDIYVDDSRATNFHQGPDIVLVFISVLAGGKVGVGA